MSAGIGAVQWTCSSSEHHRPVQSTRAPARPGLLREWLWSPSRCTAPGEAGDENAALAHVRDARAVIASLVDATAETNEIDAWLAERGQRRAESPSTGPLARQENGL